MKYFKDCKTLEDVKKTFKELVKRLHPDNGGNQEDFKNMMNEYQTAFNNLKDIHVSSTGETYRKQTTETPEEFASAVDAVINIDGIDVILVGSWIWLDGNTYNHKDVIKSAGYLWSSKHKKWYYNGDKTKSRKHGKKTFQEIEIAYGAEIIKKSSRIMIETA